MVGKYGGDFTGIAGWRNGGKYGGGGIFSWGRVVGQD